MIPAILGRARQDLPPEARALRGLAWTVSVPIGVPTLLSAAFLLYFLGPFALAGGAAEAGPRILRSLAWVAAVVAVPALVAAFFLNAPFPWLAAAFGLTCAAPFLVAFGARLGKALRRT